jgi:hypothetical protein
MPENQAADPITGQEIAFAHLVLSGTMTDRRAAEIAGLHPDSAAYIKSKPCVRAYMAGHQAAVPQQLVKQDPTEPPFTPSRGQILNRLWEIANINPEVTRGSLSGQVKALSMIAAIEGLIPDRRAASAQNKPVTPPVTANIYQSAWLPNRKTVEDVDLPPAPPQQENASQPSSAPTGAEEAPLTTPPAPSLAPRVPMADYVTPDTRVPFSIQKNRFGRRR